MIYLIFGIYILLGFLILGYYYKLEEDIQNNLTEFINTNPTQKQINELIYRLESLS